MFQQGDRVEVLWQLQAVRSIVLVPATVVEVDNERSRATVQPVGSGLLPQLHCSLSQLRPPPARQQLAGAIPRGTVVDAKLDSHGRWWACAMSKHLEGGMAEVLELGEWNMHVDEIALQQLQAASGSG